MQDKNITTDIIEQSQQGQDNANEQQQVTVNHCFYQLSGELLSKPKALCDIIELEGRPSTIVFCNLPSDTDMVEAVLNRQGISATKIIGNVPPLRVSKAMKSAQAGEITAIVVTDIGARHLEVEEIDLVINYSIPDDPEIYLHRIGNNGLGGKLHKIISFVNPLDISNFHYLKKLVGFPFQEMTLPSPQDLLQAKLTSLRKNADVGSHLEVEHIRNFASQLAKAPEDCNLLSLLLYNTLEVLPHLQTSTSSDNRRDDDDSFSERSERGGYRQQRDRNSSRGGRRQGDNDRNSGSGYQDRRSSYDNRESRSNRDNNRYEKSPRRSHPTVTVNETRIYLGLGAEHGFSEDVFKKILSEDFPETVNELRRFSLRKCYAFADFPEEIATKLLEQLTDRQLDDGNRLTLINAATISTQREDPESEESLSQPSDADNHECCGCDHTCNENVTEDGDTEKENG